MASAIAFRWQFSVNPNPSVVMDWAFVLVWPVLMIIPCIEFVVAPIVGFSALFMVVMAVWGWIDDSRALSFIESQKAWAARTEKLIRRGMKGRGKPASGEAKP